MNLKRTIAALCAAALFPAAGVAQHQHEHDKPAAGATPGGGAMPGGMMDGPMMQMMQQCRRMGGGAMLPQLPPGNEKLQLQMHAEMMQKAGEVLARYASQIKEPARPAR